MSRLTEELFRNIKYPELSIIFSTIFHNCLTALKLSQLKMFLRTEKIRAGTLSQTNALFIVYNIYEGKQ